jgi:hypothetical protein
MKQRNQTYALLLTSAVSILYTIWVYSNALLAVIAGRVEGPNAFYPWLVLVEGLVLFTAAVIPFISTMRPHILNRRSVRWTVALCLAYGILISINFFVQSPFALTGNAVRIGFRLLTWCALAYLTFSKSQSPDLSSLPSNGRKV